jgi:hypothetical protein
MTAAASLAGALEEHGFAVLAELVDSGTLAFLRKETASLGDGSLMRGGVRDVLGLSADLRTFATGGPVAAAAAALLGSDAQPIKLTLLDKSASRRLRERTEARLTRPRPLERRRRMPRLPKPWLPKPWLPNPDFRTLTPET